MLMVIITTTPIEGLLCVSHCTWHTRPLAQRWMKENGASAKTVSGFALEPGDEERKWTVIGHLLCARCPSSSPHRTSLVTL